MRESDILKTLGVIAVAGATVGIYNHFLRPTEARGLEPTPATSPTPDFPEEEVITPTQEVIPSVTMVSTPTSENTPLPEITALPTLEPTPEVAEVADRFILPLEGNIYHGYEYLQEAPRLDEGTYSHAGVDLNLRAEGEEITGWEDLGAPVLNTANGLCVFARPSESEFGNVVIMEHRILLDNGTETRVYSQYSHLGEIFVEEGRAYGIGETVGTIGVTGGDYIPHLHWEMFGKAHYLYLQDWGFARTAFDQGYVEATHYDPIVFINFRNSLNPQ
jgi:murein DD-endopeptidase MepM/ murein hydrolase activator NlpD